MSRPFASVYRALPQFPEAQIEAALPAAIEGKRSLTSADLIESVKRLLEGKPTEPDPPKAQTEAIHLERIARQVIAANVLPVNIPLEAFRVKWRGRIAALIAEWPFHYAQHKADYGRFECQYEIWKMRNP